MGLPAARPFLSKWQIKILIHDRYHPAKHNPWNEVECGDHYARALASWGCLLALSGCTYHSPGRRLQFAPRLMSERYRCAFAAAEGWGTFDQQRMPEEQRNRIELRHRRLCLESLALTVPADVTPGPPVVSVDGRAVAVRHRLDGDELAIALDGSLRIEAGDTLDVSTSYPGRRSDA